MKQRYILGDPSLVSYSGHCYSYIKSMSDELEAQGHPVLFIGNRGMDGSFASEIGAMPVFTHWCDARPAIFGSDPDTPAGIQAIRAEHERSIESDFVDLDRQIRFSKDDVFVINTLRHWGIRGVVRWLEGQPEDRAPSIVLILHFTAFPDPEKDGGTGEMYREAFQTIARSRHRDRFVLMADAQELIEEYKLFTDLPIHLAPIPHSGGHRTSSKKREAGEPLVLSYLGEARLNKGFHLLPHLAEGLWRSGLALQTQLAIQSFIINPEQVFYVRAMAGLFHDNIHFYPNQLDDREYEEFVDQADVILLPYLTDNYHSQTSGILGEAIARGTPVVTSRGTWMARQVKQYKCGTVFCPNDPLDFLNAVETVVRDYEHYEGNARDAAEPWNGFHNAGQLVEIIRTNLGRT